MKWIDLLKTIKATRVSFIALILFISLSIGTLLGTGWSGPAVEILANKYYDDHAVMDFKAISADSFSQDDVDRIRGLDDVADAEGIFTADGFMYINGEKELLSVISTTENIDKAEIIEGELPKEADEIAVDAAMAEMRNYTIGEYISIDTSLKDFTGYDVSSLNHSRFRITAFVHHPEFISNLEGMAKGYSHVYRRSFNYYALVDKSAFNDVVYPDGFSSVLIRSKSLEGADRFDDDYSKKVNSAKDGLLESIDKKNMSITDITSTTGHYTVSVAGDTGGKVAVVFSSFFFIVGLLVCYSTILRIVEEEKRLIGTKMANGFSRGSVTSKYLIYTGAAVVLGVALGLPNAFATSNVIQGMSTAALTFSGPYTYYDMGQIAAVVAFELVVMLFIAWFASAKQLRMKITSLLNSTKENSRLFEIIGKSKLIRNASVSIQSFVYNISMDSSRVIATIVGMAGSMALLIAPVSLYLVLQASPQVQFDDYFHFDHTILYDSEESGREVRNVLEGDGSKYAEVYSEDAILSRDGAKSGTIRLIVTKDKDSFESVVNMVTPDKKENKIELGNDGVYVWQAEGKDYGTGAGDIMKVSAFTGDNYDFEVASLYKCYDSGAYRIFMTSDVYEKVTGKDFEPNAFLASVSEEAESKIKDIDGVMDCIDDRKACDVSYESLKMIYVGVVALLVMLSALIAFLILLNLNMQFVKEKKQELIVMRINGFSVGAAKMYIVRDNIFLSIVSAVIGVICGLLLSNLLNSALQMEGQCIMSEPVPAACVFGVVLTMIYMIITNIIAVAPIGKLDLTDISKM